MSRWSDPDDVRLAIAEIVGENGPDCDIIEELESRGVGR